MQILLKGLPIVRTDHQDLWDSIKARIDLMPDRTMLEVVKVKAHMTKKDLLDGAHQRR